MQKNKKKEPRDFIKLLPIGLILAIVPLIVYMKIINPDENFPSFLKVVVKGVDFFAYYKMTWFITLTCISVFFLIIYVLSKKIKLNFQKLFIPLVIYSLFVFLSSSFSEYHNLAFFGFPERYEGFFTILCYLTVCFITSILVTSEFDLKYLSYFLAFSTLFISIIGITQFFGFDFFQTEVGKKIILPAANQNLKESLTFNFPKNYIYSTLYNPNYVGGFFAIILSICLVIYLSAHKVHNKIISGIFCLLSFTNLLGSESSTGLISILGSSVVIFLLLRKSLKRNIIPIISILLCFIATTIFMNHMSNGIIFSTLKISRNSTYSSIKDKFISVIKPQNNTANNINSPNYLMLMNIGAPKTKTDNLVAVNSPTKSTSINRYITGLNIEINRLFVYTSDTDALVVNLDSDTSQLTFTDIYDQEVKSVSTNDIISFNDNRFLTIKLTINESIIRIESPNTTFSVIITDEGYKLLSPSGGLANNVTAESFGFQGKEKWASGRGYIWSRSIPMIKNTLIIGHGPDTYAIFFPHDDYYAKLKYIRSIYAFVDKPHNHYLQMAINTGVISLIAFLVFVGWYYISSLKLYFKGLLNVYSTAGVACLTAVTSFLISSLANDSTISVSSIFWITLGVGIACNRLYSKSIVKNTSCKESGNKNI